MIEGYLALKKCGDAEGNRAVIQLALVDLPENYFGEDMIVKPRPEDYEPLIILGEVWVSERDWSQVFMPTDDSKPAEETTVLSSGARLRWPLRLGGL
jgi:hypothetical protein